MKIRQALSQRILLKSCVSSAITFGLFIYFMNNDIKRFEAINAKEVFERTQQKFSIMTSQLYIINKVSKQKETESNTHLEHFYKSKKTVDGGCILVHKEDGHNHNLVYFYLEKKLCKSGKVPKEVSEVIRAYDFMAEYEDEIGFNYLTNIYLVAPLGFYGVGSERRNLIDKAYTYKDWENIINFGEYKNSSNVINISKIVFDKVRNDNKVIATTSYHIDNSVIYLNIDIYLKDLIPNNRFGAFLTENPRETDFSYELTNFNNERKVYIAIDGSIKNLLKISFQVDKENYIFLMLLMVAIYCLMSYIEIQYRLKSESRRDQLTKIGNRYAFEDFWKLSLKDKKKFISITLIDIDDFKIVNDTYGHDTGDTVLKTVASIIESLIRDEDKVFRLGGEEFCIIISSDEAIDCDLIFERARRGIVEHEFLEPEPFKITVSGGSVIMQKHLCSALFKDELRIADKELYFSKKNGKNQVNIKDLTRFFTTIHSHGK
ncbi:GGDEF domain-containing protein [Vibrio caribbeanicus]|uniref:GGDEF domain-containing protein n=1 Tax=Vibrio caribbeanicus TaxID=701175 RepID=UPI0030D73415